MHVSFVDFARRALSMDNIGPVPPPVMLLSDGGHVENLGILPLLKKKLKKIIVVDGGQYSPNDETYGHDLLKAMMLARTKLNCSFVGEGGRDVISDLLENLVKPRKPHERKPRHYKFVSVNFRFTCIYFLLFGSGRTGWRIKFCFTQVQIEQYMALTCLETLLLGTHP